MWWGLQTLTSVGYGDFPVETIVGKLLAAMTAVCGVLVMALPIPIVVDNFADYYQEQKKIEAQELKEEAKVLPIMLIAKLCLLLSNHRKGRLQYIHYSPNWLVGSRKLKITLLLLFRSVKKRQKVCKIATKEPQFPVPNGKK